MTPLPWLEAPARVLAEQAANGRLPHALMLTGAEGWGDAVLANWLALHLLGADESLDAATLAHPDLRWLGPEGAIIRVDAIRELVEFAHGTPQAAPRKVAVIADAHAMNRNAANALLKTLEEPPPGTYLVLSTCRPGHLPATVRSRCQRITARPDPAAARRWLEQRVDAETLERHMFECGGAPIAVAESIAAGAAPLGPLLGEALVAQHPAALAGRLLERSLAGATARWLRYVHALLTGELRMAGLERVTARALAAFADELLWVRAQLLASNSTNERLMAERLLTLWRALPKS
jgi:DNA polymerase III subunit delta'